MKKFITIMFVFSLALIVAACSSSTDDNNDKTPVDETAEKQNGENTKDESTKTDNTDVTLEEQVIYEENDIKVTVTGLKNDSFYGPEITVLIENNSTKNITVQSRRSSINGLMVDTMFSADVAAGKKANDGITFSTSELEASGITTIKDIELALHIIDADTWDEIANSDLISLTTTADASFVQEYDDSGFVAYDADGVKVVIKKLNSSESFWGSDVYLYIENNSDTDITIQARDVAVNGFMVDPMLSSDVGAGKKAFDTMTFMESDLTDNGITDITDLEFKLHIFNTESWDTIKDTDSIKVTFD
ncbi:hypothetical protein [Ureibacillus manganicus]|uniref:hypothetical protein n=1 Tax=Ureibacillus manganicus TaxID=1266064 RepID=UPI0006900500|nr:hypothetical protein [Ureibacillus manganicus]